LDSEDERVDQEQSRTDEKWGLQLQQINDSIEHQQCSSHVGPMVRSVAIDALSVQNVGKKRLKK
jgi:hypothetical protein